MNNQLMERLLRSPRLPSLPTIALDVIDLVQQRDVNINQIAETIHYDPALSSKILKTVNSSFYAQAHAIGTISHALVVLGLNAVKTLALGFSLVNEFSDAGGNGFDHMAFWKRSLYVASAAKTLAKHLGLAQQEEVFLGGLLQDVGMITMFQVLGVEYTELLHKAGNDHEALCQIERAKYDMDHAQVGAAMGEKWGLPPLLIAPIRYHHGQEQVPGEMAMLVRCVRAGNVTANLYLGHRPGESLDTFREIAMRDFSIEEAAIEPLLKEVHNRTLEMQKLFDLPTGEFGNADDILAKANEAMVLVAMQTHQETAQLAEKNAALKRQATTDPLTGVANRGRFDEFIAEQFDLCQQTGRPLSVLFLDADHFKSFNDNHGHATGDRVLVELAGMLQRKSPTQALVARYGGEEFAVVIPECDRKSAAAIAESMRRELEENTPVISETGQTLRVTASIGVACHDGRFFQAAEQLVKAADRGVYAAKDAGRNCVRVFTPKVKKAA